MLFTAKNDTFSAMLEKALGPRFAITQVRGSLGSATAVALSMRLASLIHVTAAAECYALAAAEGVSPNLVYELIAGAAGSSAQFNKVMPRMIQGDFMPYPELGITSLDDALRDLVSRILYGCLCAVTNLSACSRLSRRKFNASSSLAG